jgi:hypothetical protein
MGRDNENGASLVRFVAEGDVLTDRVIREVACRLLGLGPLPYQLRQYTQGYLAGRRPGWARESGRPSRDTTKTGYRDLALAAAVCAASKHITPVIREYAMRNDPDAPQSACSIVCELVGSRLGVKERTVEDAWHDHRDCDPDPLTQARVILALIN